ncbi:MAG: hypothetical protein ACK4M7_09780, partial [Burkholderiales bacterium]
MVTEFYAYAAFGNILYTLGLETAYFRFTAQEKSGSNFNVAISLLLLSSLFFSGILIVCATPLVTWLHYPGCERCVYYLAAILATDTLLVIPFAQLRLQKQAYCFVYVKLFQIGMNVILNVLFLNGSKIFDTGGIKFLGGFSKVEYILLA